MFLVIFLDANNLVNLSFGLLLFDLEDVFNFFLLSLDHFLDICSR